MIDIKDPIMSDEIEYKLWRRLVDDSDLDARVDLINHFLPYARQLAAMFYAKRPNNVVEFNDYLQLANIGLIESVDRYRPDHNASFKTFASYRIKGSILNGLVKTTELNEQIAFKKRLQKERVGSLLDDTDNNSNDSLFGELVDVAIGLALVYMLDETELVKGSSESTVSDPYSNHEMEQLQDRLRQALAILPERESLIIRYHYFHQVGFDDLSQMLGISKGRVSQLHKRGLSILREGISERQTLDVEV